jgi:hypothetical protein
MRHPWIAVDSLAGWQQAAREGRTGALAQALIMQVMFDALAMLVQLPARALLGDFLALQSQAGLA